MSTTQRHPLITRATTLLERWIIGMERWWTPTSDGLGVFGFGYSHWGVQAAWRYAAALAVMADQGGPQAVHWRHRALLAMRYLVNTHLSGNDRLLDGQQWGRTWISALALERALHGIRLLEPYATAEDRTALDRVLIDEAQWLCDGYHRSGVSTLTSTRWAKDGGNHGESNLWNGCLLWRTAERLPHHPLAAAWRERAHCFLVNGVSVSADGDDDRIIGGKPVRERVSGAGFFDHYAFDHHGYLNIGYMVICTSHAAILHFDARLAHFATPDSLHHHQADLWEVIRRMTFGDGRLARIGGDSRVRYGYCQEYLIPSALYAADHLGDAHALELVEGWLTTAEREATWTGDGSFYGRRLEHLVEHSPNYWLRLESDRACALSMLISYLPLVHSSPPKHAREESVAGSWSEPEHGAILHRSPKRLAAFSWRAYGLAQGTCLPPADGNLAEWSGNLVGRVDFADLHVGRDHRQLIAQNQTDFTGGFITWGRLALGCTCAIDEAARSSKDGQAMHYLAFAALPDGSTVLAIEVVRVGALHALVRSASALHLNLPNDCFNDLQRVVHTAQGKVELHAGEATGMQNLNSRWALLAPGLACIGLTGGTSLALDRSRSRRGGHLHTLHVEEVMWGSWAGFRHAAPGTDLLDASWMIRSGGDAKDAETCAVLNASAAVPQAIGLRAVRVKLPDGKHYALALNLQDTPTPIIGISGDIIGGNGYHSGRLLMLPAFGSVLMCCE